jgi:ABC-2 type transport system ATP-binding protein
MTHVVRADGLSRRVGHTEAVRGLTFDVPAGSVCALIGPNGAGKTTTLRLLLNLLAPDAGRAEVLGVDSRRLTPDVLARIGYVSESQALPEWMTFDQLCAYCAPLYRAWDPAVARALSTQLMLPGNLPVKAMSRGMRMKALLVLALAPRPELVVMDEPFSGLDPLMREEVIAGLRGTAGERTVLISSHEVDEVERLADWIVVINEGRLAFAESLTTLRARFRDVDAACDAPPDTRTLPASWLAVEWQPGVVRFVDSAFDEAGTRAAVAAHLAGGRVVATAPTSLRRAFLALARHFREHAS